MIPETRPHRPQSARSAPVHRQQFVGSLVSWRGVPEQPDELVLVQCGPGAAASRPVQGVVIEPDHRRSEGRTLVRLSHRPRPRRAAYHPVAVQQEREKLKDDDHGWLPAVGPPFATTAIGFGTAVASSGWAAAPLSRARKVPSSAMVDINGAGNTTVLFLSTPSSTRVCRLRNCSASGWAIMVSEASPKAAAASDSPSAAMIFARFSRSASAWRAIARFMLSGSWMSFS